MGLSNRERTGKILYCVREIIEKAESLKGFSLSYSCKDKIERLIVFCNNLWPTLLGSESNSVHWLLGSSSHNPVVIDNEDLWSVAVTSSIPRVDEGKISKDITPDNDGYNPIKDVLTIPSLLVDSDKKDIACICEIYELVENIIYALRRYNDEYLEQKKEFSDLIANIQGTCFSILYENPDFSKCYIVHQICKILYADHYRINYQDKYKDVVDEWLHYQNMHHDITRVISDTGEDIEWIVNQHLILLGSEGVELKRNRILVALRMSGRRHYYDHQHKNLIEIISKDKDFSDKKFLSALSAEFKACKNAKIEYDKDSNRTHEEKYQPYNLYGYNATPEKKVIISNKPKKKAKKNAKTNS